MRQPAVGSKIKFNNGYEFVEGHIEEYNYGVGGGVTSFVLKEFPYARFNPEYLELHDTVVESATLGEEDDE